LVVLVLQLDRKMGRLADFFSGACKACVEMIATVSLAGEEVDPSWLPEGDPMSMVSEYFWAWPITVDSRFEMAAVVDQEEVADGALLRVVASSPWMLKITPSRANTPILISSALTISEAMEVEYVKGSPADTQNDSSKAQKWKFRAEATNSGDEGGPLVDWEIQITEEERIAGARGLTTGQKKFCKTKV
jgi:hypothetical protein